MQHYKRWVYPVLGALLGTAALFGFVLLRADVSQVAGMSVVGSIRAELLAQPGAYAYLGLWTALTLVGFGFTLGRREDVLWHATRTDPSTGLANRRLLQTELANALRAHAMNQAPVSLLIIDVDGLKALNDVLGHAGGDAALRLVAESVRATCRASDLAVRWGGDEFVVLARGTTAPGAVELGERVRGTLRRLCAARENEGLPSLTVSIGVADVERAGSAKAEILFYAADRALYEAKGLGRDRVALATPHAAAGRIASATRLDVPVQGYRALPDAKMN
jgi:diguanylate cyclase (GGDEF)-like protein